MMQDREQYHHQTRLGCNQVHEQCCWTLLSTDLLCVSTSGPTYCPHFSDKSVECHFQPGGLELGHEFQDMKCHFHQRLTEGLR